MNVSVRMRNRCDDVTGLRRARGVGYRSADAGLAINLRVCLACWKAFYIDTDDYLLQVSDHEANSHKLGRDGLC